VGGSQQPQPSIEVKGALYLDENTVQNASFSNTRRTRFADAGASVRVPKS
jgi:hypothetical protein